MAKRCEAKTAGGAPCRAWAVVGSAYCVAHDPDAREAQQRARRKGGKARARQLTPPARSADYQHGAGPILALLEGVTDDLLARRRRVDECRAVAYLARTALGVIESTEFEERLAAVERALETRGNMEVVR